MPKLKETKDAYIIEPTFLEQLMPALVGVLQGVGKLSERKTKRQEKEDQQLEESAKLLASITDLSKTDPEKATELLQNPAVAKFLDPKRMSRIAHEDEGLITKMRHKKEHTALAAPSPPMSGFVASPQLLEARRKAKFEADKAESEASAQDFKNALVMGLDDPTLKEMFASGATFNEANYAMFASRGATAKAAVAKGVPGTPEWAQEKASTVANDLLKEFPDADPGDTMQFARSMFDPTVKLDPEVKKRLGKSASQKRIDLDVKSMQIRERELGLNLKKLQYDTNKAKGDLAQFLVQNGIDSSTAVDAANTMIETGAPPEGFEIPKDAKVEADRLHQEATTKQLEHALAIAQVKTPQIDFLLDAASKEPDDGRKQGFINEAYKLMCQHGGLKNCEGPKAGFFQRMGQKMLEQRMEQAKVGYKGLQMVDGVLRTTARALTHPEEFRPAGAGPTSSPKAAPRLPPLGPEVEALTDRYVTAAQELMANPSTPPEVKEKIQKNALALAEALKAKDYAKIMTILGEVQQ